MCASSFLCIKETNSRQPHVEVNYSSPLHSRVIKVYSYSLGNMSMFQASPNHQTTIVDSKDLIPDLCTEIW